MRVGSEEGPEIALQDSFREVVAEVLAANDIVDVLGSYLELKPSGGSRFIALCPFHNEKTPSFTINRDRQAYYCFGCEKHGDTITFLREHEGLSFKEALQKLADRGGIRLPAQTGGDSQQDQVRMQVLNLGKLAVKVYREMLRDHPKGEAAREHLAARRLQEETISRFNLGCAPDLWDALTNRGRKDGYSETALEASGLVKRNDAGRCYDRFRNRLMFPIRDVSGNIVAFGGRALGDDPAKYINSPENSVYKKSRILYGLYESRDAIRKTKRAILVEGYFDALRCFDAGIENVVATCGTALTPEQAALIRRYATEVVVVFDGDAAGIRAALRGTSLLTAAGLTVRVLVLPEEMDPDDFIKERGGEAFTKLVEDSRDFVSFYVQKNPERVRSIEGRTELARELFAILFDIDDEMRRDEYLKHLAKELDLNASRCREEFTRYVSERKRSDSIRQARSEGPPASEQQYRHSSHDLDFLSILMRDATLLEHARREMVAEDIPAGHFGEVLICLLETSGGLEQLESEGARHLYAEAANVKDRAGGTAKVLVMQYIRSLQTEKLRKEESRIQNEIEDAQRLKEDQTKITSLVREKMGIQREIDKVGAV